MLNRYYDSVMKNYYGDILDTFKAFDESSFMPKVYRDKFSVYRVETDDNGLTLSIDVPGVKLDDISCSVIDREVRVTGNLRGEEFKYMYKISNSYDVNEIEATLENGVLSLRFKKFDSLSKNIKIKLK